MDDRLGALAVSRDTLLWTLVVFFGASVTFGLLRNLTEGEATAVRLGVQVAALVVIVGLIALVVRRGQS
jgi:uncharacterized membrane protein YhaH (DUF805 family)